ncbi:hypothetical protein AB0E62_38485 [Streptomyces sp. NPDC038707]|uniref:hypothetical protein n=1 Tax=Streptomyces sp. NPDC038707 TaxID=3154329 RepID=UPI0033E35441
MTRNVLFGHASIELLVRLPSIGAAGAGITMDSAEKQNGVHEIRKATLELLDNPIHARNARRLRDEMRAMPSPGDTVAGLERLTAAF